MINSNDDIDLDFKTKLEDNNAILVNQQQQPIQTSISNNNSNYANTDNNNNNNKEKIEDLTSDSANYRIFVDDNDSELDANNKIDNESTTMNEMNNNEDKIDVNMNKNEDKEESLNKELGKKLEEEEEDDDDQKSLDSSTNINNSCDIGGLERKLTANENKQQLLDLDEDAFYFTDSLLANNLQVALWRRELEQRLNPASPTQLSPTSSKNLINSQEDNCVTNKQQEKQTADDEVDKTRINHSNGFS